MDLLGVFIKKTCPHLSFNHSPSNNKFRVSRKLPSLSPFIMNHDGIRGSVTLALHPIKLPPPPAATACNAQRHRKRGEIDRNTEKERKRGRERKSSGVSEEWGRGRRKEKAASGPSRSQPPMGGKEGRGRGREEGRWHWNCSRQGVPCLILNLKSQISNLNLGFHVKLWQTDFMASGFYTTVAKMKD